MIIIVTGGRDYTDRRAVFAALDAVHTATPVYAVAHGDCPTGADSHAAAWAEAHRADVLHWRFPARWARDGRAAGPRRNQWMIDFLAGADDGGVLVLAFPGGRGTADCMRRARAAGMPVREVAP